MLNSLKYKLFYLKQKMMVGYQAVQGKKFRTQVLAAVCSYGGSGLAGCARNGDVQLRCYFVFYISILEDFSHAE